MTRPTRAQKALCFLVGFCAGFFGVVTVAESDPHIGVGPAVPLTRSAEAPGCGEEEPEVFPEEESEEVELVE